MLKLYVADDVFYPAQCGLGVGDTIDIVLVAGGNAGGTVNSAGGSVGQNSSFGSYAIAYAGKGAKGATAALTNNVAAGGGGGFVPGSPWQGGNGVSATATVASAPAVMTTSNGGGARNTYQLIVGGNGACFGGGTGFNNSNVYGEGGAGYGAGGGAISADGYYGGAAGQILYYGHVITADDVANGIPITIGAGGPSSQNSCNILGVCETATAYTASTYSSIIGKALTASIQAVPTFSLYDGTFGIAQDYSMAQQSAVRTTHVKLAGTDKYLPIATAFPGCFLATPNKPFFYCNGWFVQCAGSASGTTVYAWDAAKVKAGTITEADKVTVTYGTTTTPVGFNNTDMIMYVDATHIKRYINWTPTNTTPTDVTLTAAVAWIDGAGTSGVNVNAFYISIGGTTAFFPITFSPVSSAGAKQQASGKYISNYTTGTTSATSFIGCALWYIAASTYLCYGVDTSYMSWGNYTNTNTASTITYMVVGKGVDATAIDSGGTPNPYHASRLIVGTKGVCTNASLRDNAPVIYGWNNNPGVTGANGGSGAGGCCLITW